MGILLGDGTANFFVTLVSVFLLARFSVAAKLMEGLCAFHAQSTEDQSPDTSAHKGNSRTARWLNKAAVRQKVYAEGAEKLVQVRLPLGGVSKCPFYDELEILVNLGVVLLSNAVVCVTPLTDFKLASISWLLCIASVVPLVVLALLAKAEVFTEISSKTDKLYVWMASLLASALAFAVTFLPSSVLDFDWESAAEDLSQAIMKTRQKVHVVPGTVGNLQIPDMALRALLSVLAGLLVGVVLPATIRVARSFMLAAQSPPATAKFVNSGLPQLLRLQLAAALPFLAALAWFRPMAQDQFGLSDDVVDVLRAGLMLATAGATVLAVRPLLTGYLSSGLVVWWTYRHAMTSWDRSARAGDLIQMRVKNINVLMCKAALEFMAPAVLWGATGCILVYAAIQANEVPGYTWLLKALQSGPQGQSHLLSSKGSSEATSEWLPCIFLANACGFLAWFSSLCWSLGLSVFIALFRTGLLPEV